MLRVTVVTVTLLLPLPARLPFAHRAFPESITFAQAETLRLDLAKLARASISHPALLAADGYGATYTIELPDQQTVVFSRAAPSAEFEELRVEIVRGAITEVRASKTGEPSALVIRPGTAGLAAFWDLPPGTARIPPAPPAAEVHRRFDFATNLLAKAQQFLGLTNFRGGESGTVEVRIAGVEDLSLESRGAEPLYTYAFFALAKENMFEELEAESTAVTLSIGVGPDRVTVRRRTAEAGGAQTIAELNLEGATWQATWETIRPGQRPVVEQLPRSEAERLLADGLQGLRNAREYFGIGFGRDLAGIRLP